MNTIELAQWKADYERTRAQLAPFVRVDEDPTDGAQFFYFDPETTPGPLAQQYFRLQDAGWANGWLPKIPESEEAA
mgnify:CR=1 FL=1